jgi:hypothetical protein
VLELKAFLTQAHSWVPLQSALARVTSIPLHDRSTLTLGYGTGSGNPKGSRVG